MPLREHDALSAIGSGLRMSTLAIAELAPPILLPPTPRPHELLLTIAVPTWNRSGLLTQLLDVLVPQVASHPGIELLICDNGSTDDTQAVVARHDIPNIRYHRQPENIGSDANFVSAFHLARGRYFWLCGDDDLPVPNAVDSLLVHLERQEYDLVYVTSYGYRENWLAERQQDPLGRTSHTITDPLIFTRVVNIMFTFISGMIVNRKRLLDLREDGFDFEDPSAFVGTHLTQLSWTLPLLRSHRRSLVLWQRPVACRLGHNGGYDLARIFGQGLLDVTTRCLPQHPDLVHAIVNSTLRRWFPSIIYDIRSSGNQSFALEEAETVLSRTFETNLSYWLFTWPVLKLPLFLARLWVKAGAAVSRVIYMLTIPGFWRKQT